jgi:hypothetical protein
VQQEFLAISTSMERLRAECRWLRAELAVMRAVPSLPAVDLAGNLGRVN